MYHIYIYIYIYIYMYIHPDLMQWELEPRNDNVFCIHYREKCIMLCSVGCFSAVLPHIVTITLQVNVVNNNEINIKLIGLVTAEMHVLPCFDFELIINRPSPQDVIQ